MNYWKINQSWFPILATIARHYLQIPATSTPIESSFSIGSLIISKTQNRLSKDVFKVIAYLKSWDFIKEEEEEDIEEEFIAKLVL